MQRFKNILSSKKRAKVIAHTFCGSFLPFKEKIKLPLKTLIWVAIFLLTFSRAFAQNNEALLDWQLENPFRYFATVKELDVGTTKELRSEIYKKHLNAYNTLKNNGVAPTIFSIEEKLQHDSIIQGNTGGWSESIGGDKRKRTTRNITCWFFKTQNHRERCWPFFPRKHYKPQRAKNYTIRVFLTKERYIIDKKCQWKLEGTNKKPCSDYFKILVAPKDKTEIKAKIFSNGESNGTQSETTINGITEKFIVGFGDSFGSGQGNPDLPARFTALSGSNQEDGFGGDSRVQKGNPIRTRLVYEKGKRTDAIWIDRRCHRSAYSFQTRTALHYAVTHPKEATVFANYSCDGAVISDILNTAKEANDPEFPVDKDGKCLPYKEGFKTTSWFTWRKGFPWIRFNWKESIKVKSECKLRKYVKPQLVQFYEDFCKKGLSNLSKENIENHKKKLENIDWKQKLKIGQFGCKGKTVFFKNPDIILVSAGGNDAKFYQMVTTLFAGPLMEKIAQIPFDAHAIKLDEAEKNVTDKRQTFLDNYRELSKELEKLVGKGNNHKVILTGYPSPEYDEKGKMCDKTNTRSKIYKDLAADQAQLKKITEGILPKLDSIMKDAAKDHGWSFICREIFQDKYKEHGICAGKEEEYKIPSKLVMGRPGNIYKKRSRWFLTMDDAYLSINQIKRKRKKHIDQGAAKWLYVGASGAIHPNSYGAAAIADITYQRMIDVLKKNKKNEEPRCKQRNK